MRLSALQFEYEKKQAAAKSEEERKQLQHEEDLKRQQIIFDNIQKVSAIKAEEEVRAARKDVEISRERGQRNFGYIIASILGIAALVSIWAFNQKRKDNSIISREKQRSEDLLLNILPVEVAEELKRHGEYKARQYDEVSVLFTDFVNFTGTAEKLSPQQLVQELHECFTAFDAIIERNGLEKIKTIGDAYMAVCGLPVTDSRHAQCAVQAAIEIRDFVRTRLAAALSGRSTFQIRIGINSGSVVAGIVGVKKFAYDIWGDTVNTAARMEQHSEPGRINVSQSTYELVKEDFPCVHRGRIAAKNKGEVEMYFVEAATLQPV